MARADVDFELRHGGRRLLAVAGGADAGHGAQVARLAALLGPDFADNAVPIDLERLVSAKTAKQLQFLMWLTVQKGTGTHAQVPGYLVGGKTGTADRADPIHGGYLRNSVISSFAGVFPIDDPHYLVLIMLDDPHGAASAPGTLGAGAQGTHKDRHVATVANAQ
jgi:cell division protein FtsI (penicillin-binding protein 3)